MSGSSSTGHEIEGNGELKLDVKLSDPILVYPAEPTQKHVYSLSNLDQIFVVPVSTVYFFNSRQHKKNHDAVAVIKDSLRKLLVLYYPMAGRLGLSEDSKFQIQCQGQGVPFVEAAADCAIAELGERYRPAPFMTQLVYNNPPTSGHGSIELDVPLMCVQVTQFKCGGFVLGLYMNHCIADAFVASEFLVAWGELARSVDIPHLVPNLDRTLLNPRSPLRIEFPHLEFREMDEVIFPRTNESSTAMCSSSFTVSPHELESVKRRILHHGLVTQVTTFEALAALTWQARTQAVDMHPDQVARLVFSVNIRSKLDPPLPARFLGNGVFLGHATATAAELTQYSLAHIVKLVQDAKALVTDSYIRSAIDYLEVRRGKPKAVALLYISSWTRIPMNVVDFGWGEPICMGPCSLMEEDAIFACCGDDMKSFEVFIGLPSLQAVETLHRRLRTTILSCHSPA